MNHPTVISRRDFVRTSTGLALGATLASATGGGCSAAPAREWPVTCRDVLFKETGQPDCWAAMALLGIDGAEVDVNPEMECNSLSWPAKKYSLATEDGIKQVKDAFAEHRRTIAAFCMHNRLDERLEQEVEWTRKLVKACGALGVSVIRIDVVPRKTKPEEFLPFAIQACRRLCAVAEGTPVRFGIENHGKITNDPEFLDRLFDGVGSTKLGLTMDFLNFYWFGHPLESLYGIYEKFAPRAFHTHCKSVRYPEDQRNVRRTMGWEYGKYSAPIYEGDIDYRRVAALLRKTGYAGVLCLENECLRKFPAAERTGVMQKEIALLRSVAKPA